ncbi:MAG: class I SAM-dependent methyltransferase [Syntrophomonas sp.]
MKDIFEKIYQGNMWGDKESVSGPGSRIDATREITRLLPELIERFQIKSILDAACGDFNWMRHLILNVDRYIGVDIVRELINKNTQLYTNRQRTFITRDISSEPLPQVDLIICRDCLVHLPFEKIRRVISNFKNSRSKYLLTTNFTGINENSEINTGNWRRLNFEIDPFNFPQPLFVIIEHPPFDKTLALWDLNSILLNYNENEAGDNSKKNS